MLDVGEGCPAGVLARRGQLKGEGDMELRCTTWHGSSEGGEGRIVKCWGDVPSCLDFWRGEREHHLRWYMN